MTLKTRPQKSGDQPIAILLSGFSPFGGLTRNPSWDAVEQVIPPPGTTISRKLLPVEYQASLEQLARHLRTEQPNVVICTGVASRSCVGVERVAINVIDAHRPDGTGLQPVDEVIAPEGPAAYFATLPIKNMVREMRARGLPSEISNTADTLECNHLFYGIMRLIEVEHLPIRAGFIHVPLLPEQVVDNPRMPCMHLEGSVQALQIACRIAGDELSYQRT